MRDTFAATGLSQVDPASTRGVKNRAKAEAYVASLRAQFIDQQTRLYAERDKAVVLLLQGMDACGKDGVVRHVVDLFYPTSVRVTAFKAPTEEEKAHDFLWRFRPHLPTPGNIAVLNRSWYEDVGVVKVHSLAPAEVIEERYALINDFELQAADAGITVIKCFLHISYEEQGSRMLDRLERPDKRWKFAEGDLVERSFWSDYMVAYDTAIRRCQATPWYVIPADHKWYRDFVVAQLILDTMQSLELEYPQPALDIAGLTRRIKES